MLSGIIHQHELYGDIGVANAVYHSAVYHSVLIPQSIWTALDRWHEYHRECVGRQALLEAVIGAALLHPLPSDLDRLALLGALGSDDPATTRSIGLRKTLWDKIEVYRRRVRLPARGVTLRALLCLGLGLPGPRRAKGLRPPPGPHDGARVRRIVALHGAGCGPTEIAIQTGVSRQYAQQVIKRLSKPRPLVVDALQDEIARLATEGRSTREIAATVRAPHQYVRKALDRPVPPTDEPVRWWENAP